MTRSTRLVWLLLPLLAACQRPTPLQQAQRSLARAEQLDSQLDSSDDPARVSAVRDRAFDQAARLFAALPAEQAALPETQLGLASIAWRRHQNLPAAFAAVNGVIQTLQPLSSDDLRRPRASGATGQALLARAYAARASYLVSRYTESGAAPDAPPRLPPGPLQQALEDADRAVGLDPQRDFILLRDSLRRLEGGPTAPLDPAGLTSREPAK